MSYKRTDLRVDLTGQRFGTLTVLTFQSKGKGKSTKWNVICDCGVYKTVAGTNLTQGGTKTCGSGIYRSGSKSKLWKGYREIPSAWWTNSVVNSANGSKGNKRKSLEIDIVWDGIYFLSQNRQCALTGRTLNFSEPTASLDRIDSDKGYVLGNVQWVHKDVNIMKNDFDLEYFKNICRDVAKHNA